MKWKIVLFDGDMNVVTTKRFLGDYDDARKLGSNILYANDRYWGMRVDMDW